MRLRRFVVAALVAALAAPAAAGRGVRHDDPRATATIVNDD
jgi:hypothetical protein